jgi:hypothetical protein
MADETSDRDASQPWTIPGMLESDAQGTVFDQCRIEVFSEVETETVPTAGARPVEIVGASGEDAGDESVDVRSEPTLVRSRAAALSDDDGAFRSSCRLATASDPRCALSCRPRPGRPWQTISSRAPGYNRPSG